MDDPKIICLIDEDGPQGDPIPIKTDLSTDIPWVELI
jgi:hypothetical protein